MQMPKKTEVSRTYVIMPIGPMWTAMLLTARDDIVMHLHGDQEASQAVLSVL